MVNSRLPMLICSTLAVAGLVGTAQAADIGVSIGFSQPGVYGRVDIGQYPRPELLAPQPVLIERLPRDRPPPEPVYLWVPPDHREHWARHCREYHACGHPVYFVNHDWYQRNVIAHAAHREEPRRDEGRREGEHHDEGRRDERERGRDHD
jgi:hypothetical protein